MSNSNGYFEHTTIDGDRWDLLAYHFYGDASKQAVLVEANMALFSDPLVTPPLLLPSGLKIKVPVIDSTTVNDDDLPPWKRQGGSGG